MIKYEDIFNCINDYIVVTDEHDKIVFSNHEEAKILYDNLCHCTDKEIIEYQDKYYNFIKKEISNDKNQKYYYNSFQDITNFYKQNKLLQEQVITDPLTCVLNRYGIENAINDYRTSLDSSCVIYCDIDYFKRVNDNYSHDAGDLVLNQVAKILKDNVRKEDLVGRMGGEEFLIILNSTNIEKSRPKIEQLKGLIQNHDFIWNNQIIKITMSFGVSEFLPGSNFREAIIAADEALKYSKETGRNKVTYVPPKKQVQQKVITKKKK
ncbi:MAG: GGDEF domain-containing protein [Bacilli bacterium]|nr:GGDEF domain-containing protein [Bacilli bacterium]MDD4607780.1 GGDEF domain-containing protein [Bacilli bacterium]